jgi:hypothetical protein
MKTSYQIPSEIARVADILEQIKSVDDMIALHQSDENDLMKSQYLYKRNMLMNELKECLLTLNINLNDIAA